jgi:hypothetical protein
LDAVRDREFGIRAKDVTHSTTYFATEVARVNDFLQGVTVAKIRPLHRDPVGGARPKNSPDMRLAQTVAHLKSN